MAKVISVLLGVAVSGLLLTGILLTNSARSARNEARRAADNAAQPAADDHASHASSTGTLVSYAGSSPENADALATAHTPYPARLRPVPAGDVVKVHMTLKDVTIEIAPGVRYQAWGFEGGAPGPVIHVRQGQTVEMTLTNGGAIPHSIDFHAARVAPNKAFRDVAPGESFTFRFKASAPGVYMYHCGTKPVLAHIANGMYGAIIVEPAKPLPPADREYALVASEWYMTNDGVKEP